MYSMAFLCLSIFVNSIYAQADFKHASMWNTTVINAKLNDQFQLKGEFHFRSTHFLADWEQQIIRPSLVFSASNELEFSLGYSYIKNYNYASFSTPINAKEHNIWQQILIKQFFKKFNLSHRLRFEERFIDNILELENNQFIIDGDTYKNRFRYRFTVKVPLINTDSGQQLYAITFDEVFLNIEKMRPQSFQQNWMFFGLGYKFNKNITVQSGYHDAYTNSSKGKILNQIWETTVVLNLL